MTSKQVQAAADEMIGAAQVLERAARELKAQAKTLRARPDDVLPGVDQKLWNMHKRSDVSRAATLALAELGPEY